MAAVTEILRDAQALAEFSNLEPKDVENFRNNYPNFVPRSWWDYESTYTNSKGEPMPSGEKQWKKNQQWVREEWERHFSLSLGLFFIMRLTLSVFDPDDLLDVSFFPQLGHRPRFAAFAELPAESCPHQNAVLYLAQEPWRARFCQECQRRFVAAEPKNKYCSERCSHESRNRQKRRWFTERGSQLRANRMKRKRAPRVPGSRRKRDR